MCSSKYFQLFSLIMISGCPIESELGTAQPQLVSLQMSKMYKRFDLNVFWAHWMLKYAQKFPKVDSNISEKKLLGPFIFRGPQGEPPKKMLPPKLNQRPANGPNEIYKHPF
jgi:hypothetical protein